VTFFVKRAGQRDGVPVGEPEYPDDHGGVDAQVDDWALFLPHRCDAWRIAIGSRVEVLAAGLAFRAELDRAIKMLEQGEEQR
jgi:hypothetical protein